jgi:hypothetical protein
MVLGVVNNVFMSTNLLSFLNSYHIKVKAGSWSGSVRENLKGEEGNGEN